MGTFTFVSYTGPDAGRVLVGMLAEGVPEAETHELDSEAEERRPMGFQPNPEPESENEEEPEEDDGEGTD